MGFSLRTVKGLAWEEVWADSRTSLKRKITARLEKLDLSVHEEKVLDVLTQDTFKMVSSQ